MYFKYWYFGCDAIRKCLFLFLFSPVWAVFHNYNMDVFFSTIEKRTPHCELSIFTNYFAFACRFHRWIVMKIEIRTLFCTEPSRFHKLFHLCLVLLLFLSLPHFKEMMMMMVNKKQLQTFSFTPKTMRYVCVCVCVCQIVLASFFFFLSFFLNTHIHTLLRFVFTVK